MNIIIRSCHGPRKMANDPHGGQDPQVENHCSSVWCSYSGIKVNDLIEYFRPFVVLMVYTVVQMVTNVMCLLEVV